MAEQATGTVEGTGAASTPAHGTAHMPHNPGRPISWVGTSIVIVGFVVGGIAFVPEPHWIPFWIGAGVSIVGLLVLAFSKAMNTDWY